MDTAGTTRITGVLLNMKWGVGAKHALYHRDGHWYNNLDRFPGALFDPHGYVVFENEARYRNSPFLRVSKETNVPGGISSLPGYVPVSWATKESS